jgi:hypothetical protein
MDTTAPQASVLVDLETLQEQLIADLDELNRRVEKTLAECQAYRVGRPTSNRDA